MHRVTDIEWCKMLDEAYRELDIWGSENMGPNSIEYMQWQHSQDYEDRVMQYMYDSFDDLYWEVGGWVYYDEVHPAKKPSIR